MTRERWVCPKCGHTEDLLPGTTFYKKGIVEQSHTMKKEKQND